MLRAAGALDGYFVGTGHAIDGKAVRQARKEFRSMKNRGLNGVRLQVQAEGITAERLAGLRKIVGAGARAPASSPSSRTSTPARPRRSSSCARSPAATATTRWSGCSRCTSRTAAASSPTRRAARAGRCGGRSRRTTSRRSATAACARRCWSARRACPPTRACSLHYRLADRNVVYGVHVDAGAAKEFGAGRSATAVEKAIAPAGRPPRRRLRQPRARRRQRPGGRLRTTRAARSRTSPTGSSTAAATARSSAPGTRAGRTASPRRAAA